MFEQVRKYETDEMRFSALVRFHTIINDSVDLSQTEIEENNPNELKGIQTIDVVGAPHDDVKDGDFNFSRRHHKFQNSVQFP